MTDALNINNNTDANTVSGLSVEAEDNMKLRFQFLPDDLQEAIRTGSYNAALFTIARGQKLTFEQLETLQLETMMALFGLSTLEEYRNALTDSFKKTPAEMDTLMQLLNEQVFDKYKNSLLKFYQSSAEEIARLKEEDELEEKNNNESPVEDDTPAGDTVSNKSNSNPFAGTLDAMPAPTAQAATVIPIKTAPVVPIPQSAPVTSTPQFVSNIAANNTGTERILSPNEKRVLGSAGVELGDQQNKMSVPEIEESMLPNRNALMDGIENPVKTGPSLSTPVAPAAPTPTIVANKLIMSTTLMPNKTSDYSVPKPTPQAQSTAKASGDPYREVI